MIKRVISALIFALALASPSHGAVLFQTTKADDFHHTYYVINKSSSPVIWSANLLVEGTFPPYDFYDPTTVASYGAWAELTGMFGEGIGTFYINIPDAHIPAISAGTFGYFLAGFNVFTVDVRAVPQNTITFSASLDLSYNEEFISFAAPVPEPSVWGLMIIGFGAVGFLTYWRRRHMAASVAALT